ncbi:hypothetical protein [Peterkaempfera sp. SMS 1(5)a]|uniref:hypothetical protein n=1 Tax=Peterkaempfera podocarpi TaxID=3232308 RepID=UPI00366B9023
MTDAKVQEGGYAKVTFAFESAGTVNTQAAVVSGRGDYASFAPAAPSPAATQGTLPTAGATGAGTASPLVTGSATPGATAAGRAVHSGGTATAGAGASSTVSGASGSQG